jgi:hypothetical protein
MTFINMAFPPACRWRPYCGRFHNEAAQRCTSSAVVAQEHPLMRTTGSPFQTAPPHQHCMDLV